MSHEGPRPQQFLEGACHLPSPGFTCAEVWLCNHGQPSHLSESVSGTLVMPFAHRTSQRPLPLEEVGGGRGLKPACSGPAAAVGASAGLLAEQSAARLSLHPAPPGSRRLTSCSGRKPSPAWKLKEASLQRPTRWQGPCKPQPPSAVQQAWPGNQGTLPMLLGFKLSPLDSDSVGEWPCHPHPAPRAGRLDLRNPSSGTLSLPWEGPQSLCAPW